MTLVVAAIPLLIWIYLIFGRGWFWRPAKYLTPAPLPRVAGKRIAIVMPARDEAAVIGQAITSLMLQDYSGPVHIFVVDDASTDGTADLARHTADRVGKSELLTVIGSQPLPVGWTGKLWALSQGIAAAERWRPDYLLLTDADIHHGPCTVAELAAIAESENSDLVSFMITLSSRTNAEKALLPAFVFFFLLLYPPGWVRSRHYRTAGAAGGCILTRREALEGIGGLSEIRNEVIDDCALARSVKSRGGRLWIGLTRTSESIRPYGSVWEIARMISRTAFNQLQHSLLQLILAIAAVLATFVMPVALLFSRERSVVAVGAAAILLMICGYAPILRFYGRSMLWCLALPLIAIFYAGVTIYSAFAYWTGRGGYWKGRIQDVHA